MDDILGITLLSTITLPEQKAENPPCNGKFKTLNEEEPSTCTSARLFAAQVGSRGLDLAAHFRARRAKRGVEAAGRWTAGHAWKTEESRCPQVQGETVEVDSSLRSDSEI